MKTKLPLVFLALFFLQSCSSDNQANIDSIQDIDNSFVANDEVSVQANFPQKEYNPVVAHRGAWLEDKLPQNSIASLERAIELRCIGSEFDVRMTEDDSLVICHDANFNGLQIEKSKYKDLLVFKYSNGEKIPTLRQYFEAAKKQKTFYTKLFCEIKQSDISTSRNLMVAGKVLGLIRELNIKENVIIISFNFSILKHIRELDDLIQLQYLTPGGSSNEVLMKNRIDLDYDYGYYTANEGSIQFAKDNNIKLNVWTVNDSKMLDYFLLKKFDYITTDYPILLKKLIVL